MKAEVEEALFRAFVVSHRRGRYLMLVASPKKRRQLLGYLPNALARDLDPRFARRIDPSRQSSEEMYTALRARGAPDRCYVIGGDDRLDGQEADLDWALDEIVGGWRGEALISCIPGRLAYLEAEAPHERYLLERNGT